MMSKTDAETVRAIDELLHARTPATVRSVANALRIEDTEATARLEQLITDGAVIMTPIHIEPLAEGSFTGVCDAYWLMVPDAVYNAEDVIGSWRSSPGPVVLPD